jgi:hypothetical protein
MNARAWLKGPRLAVGFTSAVISIPLAFASVVLYVMSFLSGPTDDVDPPHFRSLALRMFLLALLFGVVALVSVLTRPPSRERDSSSVGGPS